MTIIACTDFSHTAENAVQYAAAVAKLTGYRLILCHNYKIPLHASNSHLSAESFQKMLDGAIKKLKNNADILINEYAIEVIPEFSFADLEEQLVYLIEKYDASILVAGMPVKSLEQDLIGNTTTSIIKNINIPVLAVPAEAKFKGAGKIIFACDNPKDIPHDILQKVKDTTISLGGELEIFNVEQEISLLKSENSPALATNAVDAHLQGINYYYKNVRSNAVIDAIKKEVIESGADMLIMVPKQYGFWSSLVHRSKTRLMASGLNIPLLSIPKI